MNTQETQEAQEAQETLIPHQAFMPTYWNAFQADSECKVWEIVNNRNMLASALTELRYWDHPSSWFRHKWFHTMYGMLDHIEWYKNLHHRLMLWHDYNTHPEAVAFWNAKGFSVLPHMYSFKTVSYGVYFHNKLDLVEFLAATFSQVELLEIPFTITPGGSFNDRLKMPKGV